jgi:hypothetical protein
MQVHKDSEAALGAVKLLHTAVWIFFVGCIAGIPAAAATGRYGWAAVFSVLVMLECAVLVLNRMRCPLTDVAARYTEDRAANFDIYLPEWLARRNKEVFGTLFVLGELYFAWRWLTR